MKIVFFSARKYEQAVFESANANRHDLRFLETRLMPETVEAAAGADVVCCFTCDHLNRAAIEKLKNIGVKLIALRSAGFNHVDLNAAADCGIPVVRVPEYSPYAVAEHAVALLLALNRKINRAVNRIRELNFSLEGLVGFDLHGKTVGVIGAGKIGKVFCQIMNGFGCRILAYDKHPPDSMPVPVEFVSLERLLNESDIVSLHVPLTEATHHLIDQSAFEMMKTGAVLINTGRGGLIHTKAMIRALKTKKLGGACLDVYEEEDGIFFCDLSESGLDDDTLARLLTFPNVIVTSHQAFLTREALNAIASVTLNSVSDFQAGRPLLNQIPQSS